MTSLVIFSVSGLGMIVLVATKRLSERRKKAFSILKAISKSDTWIRKFYHNTVRFYSDAKENIFFFFRRQVRIYTRNYFNKVLSYLKERRQKFGSNLRGSRLLKKSGGISEFFKNMSNIEKGNGEIGNGYGHGSQEVEKELE